jgi:alanine racemase
VAQGRNGELFIEELYNKGVRNFVVDETIKTSAIDSYPGSNFLQVEDVQQALHSLVAWHRMQFDIPVIGITGSNGKTIVKEWLYQLLHEDYNIVRSPKKLQFTDRCATKCMANERDPYPCNF